MARTGHFSAKGDSAARYCRATHTPDWPLVIWKVLEDQAQKRAHLSIARLRARLIPKAVQYGVWMGLTGREARRRAHRMYREYVPVNHSPKVMLTPT